MKALITGAAGQVARALAATTPDGYQVTRVTHAELDIADAPAVARLVSATKPDVILNAAAYTAVDKAESEPERVRAANADGPAHLAAAAATAGARLIQISTDFVFDGTSSKPYRPGDATGPLSAYGRTKLAGEHAVLDRLKDRAVVLRTAWIYAAAGRNFVLTILRLMREKGSVRVVADQIGSPTSATSIARAVWALAANPALSGVHHWTDAGVASWYDFAVAVAEEATSLGLLPKIAEVIPITTADYPTPARRPRFSVLDCRATIDAIGIVPDHWRASLRQVLGELKNG